MTDRVLRIGRMFGIEIRLGYSWFIAFALAALSPVRHYLPSTHPGWSTGIYWVVRAITALLFFGSVLVHELAHSRISQTHGEAVRNIALSIRPWTETRGRRSSPPPMAW
jgi:Zn-dependent protease